MRVTLAMNDPADEEALKKVARLHSQEIMEQDPNKIRCPLSAPPIS